MNGGGGEGVAPPTALIQRVVHSALRTFGRTHPCANRLLLTEEEFGASFAQLLAQVEALTPADVGLDPDQWSGVKDRDDGEPPEEGGGGGGGRRDSSSSGSDPEQQNSPTRPHPGPPPSSSSSSSSSRRVAPVTYIDVLEHSDVSVGIFIVRRGCMIPLHNHPNMFGILKCLGGRFDLTSFTPLEEEEAARAEPPPHLAATPHGRQMLEQGAVFPARKEFSSGLDSHSRACYLSPSESNYHEIRASEDGPAVFIDLLAPPYTQETPSPNGGGGDRGGNGGGSGVEDEEERRDCDFFKEVSSAPAPAAGPEGDTPSPPPSVPAKEQQQQQVVVEGKLSWLQWIPPPNSYFCDSEEYRGPPITPR